MTELQEQKALDQEFQAVLEKLEVAAGTPQVSGEMESWLNGFAGALAEVQPAMEQRIRESHRPQFKTINREDLEMFRSVEKLQQEDSWIMETIQKMRDRAEVLRPMVHRIEPDEKRAEAALAELSEQGVQFVSRVRKQEIALRSWLQEAFTRDRGVVD